MQNQRTSPEFARVQGLLKRHINDFERDFKSQGKLPRSKDWRPFRFTIRDNVIGLVVIRHQFKENILEVDVCITEDPDAFEGYSGTKITTIFLLSEAYLCGSTMGICFTANLGKERVPVHDKIWVMAYDLGVNLKHAREGFITPKEARMLYLALTGFSSEAEQKVKELAVANLVTPERVCYLVHHGIWTLEEMESLLLGCEKPEAVLTASITPLNYLPYADMLLRCRTAILGGFLDRKLRLKEVVEGDKIVDLEGSACEIAISFDPRFFAKVYETLEDTPIPWTNYGELIVPAGHRIVVALRAYDWPDLLNNVIQDLEAMRAMVAAYQDGRPTQFFLLVPRDMSSSQHLNKYQEELSKLGVTVMVCPEPLVRLDSDAQQRLASMETMRHDLATGDANKTKGAINKPDLAYNATRMTLVAVPRDMKDGIVELPKLVEQALYDERELNAGVNRRNVESRYLRVMDRIVFLGKLALTPNLNTPQISFPGHVLDGIAAFIERYPAEQTQPLRLNSGIIPQELLGAIVGTLKTLFSMNINLPHLAQLGPFLERANLNRQSVIVVLNQHTKQDWPQMADQPPDEQLETAFQGLYVQDRVIDYRDKTLVQVAEQNIWNAVNSAKAGRANAVTLNELPHAIIAQALHLFSYRDLKDSDLPLSINVTYTDGSKARPFPLFRLRKRTEVEMAMLHQLRAIEIGMLSCRHPEMDEMIDRYWLRNIDMNMAGDTLAEKDEFAYQTTKEQLALILAKNIPARMNFYQTGYPPAVVGFYRAVVEFLIQTQKGTPMLEVTPCFYNSKSERYDRSKPWC